MRAEPPPPARPAPRLEDALRAWRTYELERALELSRELPGEPGHRVRALVYTAQRRLDRAAEEGAAARDAAPDDGLRALAEGILAQARGDMEGSIGPLDRACAARPADPEPFLMRARSCTRLEQVARGVADTTRAIELDPKHALAYSLRGWLREDDDPQAALADETRAFQLGHRFVTPLVNRGMLKRRQGDVQGALADLDLAIEVDPSSGLAWYSRGLVRQDQPGQAEQVLRDLNEALRAEPNLGEARAMRGLLRSQLGRHREAVEDLEQAIERDLADPKQTERLLRALARSRAALAEGESGGQR